MKDKNRTPKVTVIISSYNHEEYVADAIQSLLDQTFQDFEIVITDNGSQDNTVKEIKKFKDPRIRFFRFEKNLGACAAYDNCYKHSTGEYVSIFNSDDIYMPEKLEKQVKILNARPNLGAVFTYVKLINENGNDFTDSTHHYFHIFKQPNRSRYEWLNYFFYKGNCLCASTPLIRKSCLKKIGYNDERFAQLPDLELWTRLTLRYDIHIIQENLLKFRIRSGNMNVSADTYDSRVRNMFEFAHILKNFLHIKTTRELKKIFPEEGKKHKDIKDNELIPFYVARAALAVEHIFHQKFALDTLYDLLEDKKMIKKMQKNSNFSFPEFIKITGEHDLYHIQHIDYQKDKISQLANQKEKFKSFSYRMKYLIKKIFLPYA